MNWTVVENETKSSALIRVVGVGGAGGNAVNHMVESGIEGVQMICANTAVSYTHLRAHETR